MNHLGKSVMLCALTFACATPCYAISVVLDYTHDTFFAAHSSAKTALEAAAADISSAVTTSLNATIDSNTSTVNDSYATFDFALNYKNPSFGNSETIDSVVLPANEVRIFVGVQGLFGNTLGEGGPGGAGFNASGLPSDFNDFTIAVNNARADGNANMGRGGGPTMGSVNGNLGGIPISISYGSTIGNLWLDVDTNNDGFTDDDATLNSFWHYDHTTPVAAGKSDFYSVALHELIHALGVSGSDSWDANVSAADPRDWTGSEVMAMLGTGDNVLAADSNHIAEGVMSPRLSDGVLQEAVMDPTITVGSRKQLTNLDLAFLRDIDWDTVPFHSNPAVPGDFDGDGDVDGADFVVWQTNFPTQSGATLATGDADGDGDVDGADFVIWQTNFPFTPSPAAAPVPEPPAVLLFALALAGLVSMRRRNHKLTGRRWMKYAINSARERTPKWR